MARILVACEFSGVVRDAFASYGHDAWSCDLLPTESPGQHIQADVRELLDPGEYHWDLMLAFPPCTYLAYSGARWFKYRQAEQAEALALVQYLLDAPVPRVALENPDGIINSRIRRPDQVIEPYMFGHGERKATCLWLKNLPRLRPSNIVDGRVSRVLRASPSADRWKKRSRTYLGIAAAMAAQWGPLLETGSRNAVETA
jgi:hypothetical protein